MISLARAPLSIRNRYLPAATLLVAAFMQGSTSAANPRSAGPTSAADELFEQGKAALKLGDWNAACESFKRSHAVDPSASALVKIARCYEHDGDATGAWRSYDAALALLAGRGSNDTHTKDLVALIRTAQQELSKRYGRLRLLHPAPPPDLTISIDGKPADLRDAMLLDAGLHHIQVTAAGHRPLELDVKVAAGSTREIELKLDPGASVQPPVALARPRATSDAVGPVNPGGSQTTQQRAQGATPRPKAPSLTPTRQTAPTSIAPRPIAQASTEASHGRAQRTWGWIAGSTGVALLGAAGYFAWRTQSLVDRARVDNHCDASFSCDAVGMDSVRSAERAQLQAIVAGVGGVVLLGTGIALLVTKPSRGAQLATAPVQLVVTAFGSSLEGVF